MAGKVRRRRASRPRWRDRAVGLVTVVLLVILGIGFLAVLELTRPHVGGERLRFDTFVSLVQAGRVESVRILDEDAFVVGTYLRPPGADAGAGPGAGGATGRPPPGFDLRGSERAGPRPSDGVSVAYNAPLVRGTQESLLQLLLESRTPIEVDQQVGKRLAGLGTVLLPTLMLVILFGYFVLSYKKGTGLFGVGGGARRISPEEVGVTFADVAGQDAAAAELREVKEFLADPDRFAAVGAKVPKGVLLFGPPGCGKTLLARALAGEAGASFFSMSGSDFVELYVGVGAARVRDLFREARAQAPSVVFIDELDSIGRSRASAAAVSSSGEQEQALNQILAEMDGFSSSAGIIVLAATNRPDVLDPALLRPGRFDRTIGLERPDEAARLAILRLHTRDKPLGDDVDLAAIAAQAIGLTGADLAAVANQAALLTARAGRAHIPHSDLEAAVEHILGAPERQRRLSLRERTIGRRVGADDRVTFADVAGVDDAIIELSEVRDYLAHPERFAAFGARIPRGILLAGSPGVGKTLLARAVAGEANAAFISVAASEFVQRYAGEGASRVRDLFAEARSLEPAIVFIDEIDAIGARRSAGAAEGHREGDQTLNQILIELDGFEARTGVIIMAATNRPDILDPALVRPGRFDRQVTVTLPDRAGRRAILSLHAAGKRLGPDVDLDALAALTQGLSGADLANVLNEAALLAARRDLEAIPMSVVDEALERAVLGLASRGSVLSDEERRVVAYHEAGHALVARALPGAGSLHKLSIVPRGGTLGHCSAVDTHDRITHSRTLLLDRMASLLAGRVAEQLVVGEPQSGAAGDLQRASDLARHMVCDLGMGDSNSTLTYPGGGDGRAAYPDAIGAALEAEARQLMEEAERRAHVVLTSTRPALDALADALLARETLSATEIDELLTTTPAPTKAPAND